MLKRGWIQRIVSIALTVVLSLAVFISLNLAPAHAATGTNHDPIILVTGFTGWGRSEMNGYKYFGGFSDIQQYLRNEGYPVYTLLHHSTLAIRSLSTPYSERDVMIMVHSR